MTIINRIPKLIDITKAVDDDDNKYDIALRVAEFAKNAMQGFLEDEAPDGERWTEPYHGRPSVRLGHGPIAENWEEPDISRTSDGAKVVFANAAEHMDYILRDIPAHGEPVSAEGPMIFFWFKEGHTVNMPTVNHPGYPADRFTERAFEPKGKEEFLSAMKQEVPVIFSDMRKFFGDT